MAEEGDQDNDDSQKTEEPTAKRLEDARKKGQVVLSREVNNWLMIFASTLLLVILAPHVLTEMRDILRSFIERPQDIPLSPGSLLQIFQGLLADIGAVLFLPFLIMIVAALAGPLLQVGFLITVEPIKPSFAKISPLAGFGRLFSLRSLVEFIKSVFKFIIFTAVGAIVLFPFYADIEHMVGLDWSLTLDELSHIILSLMIGILATLFIIAVLDYAYQRYEHLKKLRMSKQEIKEEYKQMEGDPHVKGRLRQLREQKARQRMMQNVPKADVVITNPTHYAVALQYDPKTMAAPILLAKGADAVAQKIKEVAKEHKISIIENPPLARALFEQMDLDQAIPTEHFKAVAEIISYVFKLKRKTL